MISVMSCFIVSLFCPVQLFCFNDTSITDDNRYLENNLYGIIKERVSAARECAFECSAHLGCSSFGFEPTLRTCHLHKKDSSTAPTDLVTKAPWQHSDISHWPTEFMGPCQDHTCPSGRRCSVHRVTKAPLCLEVDIYQPDVCSEEQFPHAICSYASKLTEGMRTCSCHINYRDVLLDVVSVNNTCMANGSWTQPLINCTSPYLRLTTPNTKRYIFKQLASKTLQVITGGTSTMLFLVKACHDANFALHTYPYMYIIAYEVAFGGHENTKSFITGCLQCMNMAVHHESSIVSCNEYRPFWLSWKNGVISAGKGLVGGRQQFMKWAPVTPIVINHVSISTYVKNPGTWLFLKQSRPLS
ncbi:uncharacterized protein [Haliotis asinina]|uniref:uncharacterized protein n=1 Tax=Haliotis asinina TaxID=109174 RepID=UPI003531F8B9